MPFCSFLLFLTILIQFQLLPSTLFLHLTISHISHLILWYLPHSHAIPVPMHLLIHHRHMLNPFIQPL